MVRLFVSLVVVALLIGPALAAYALVPAEVLQAWPALAIISFPSVSMVLAVLALHSWQHRLDAPLPTTAAAWLRAEIGRLGKIGISVAAMETSDKNRESFYHPASQTIVLADDVFGQHSAAAHATAAHELGHALFHVDRPGLSRVLMFARTRADGVFHVGAGLLAGAALVGGDPLLIAAVGLLALAMLLFSLVLCDETIASSLALGLLRDHLGDAEQSAAARSDLRRALATYVLRFLALIAGFVCATWLAARQRDGVLIPDAALGGTAALAATITAVVVVAGAGSAVLLALRPGTGRLAALGLLLQTVAMVWCPLPAALLCAQAGAPGWAVACAVVPAWALLAAPMLAVIQAFGSFFNRSLSDLARPLTLPKAAAIRRISREGLTQHDEPDGLLARLGGAMYSLWPAPLALWWLT